MKKRDLTEEEKRLWQLVMGETQPLASKKREVPKKEKPASPYPGTVKTSVMAGGERMPPLTPGAYANIDHNTVERFRKGKYPINARLDLHGLTREKAYHAFRQFMVEQYGQGSRCLLVITGKGNPGILRQMLPQWLQEAELRPMVLAFDSAKPQHGGAGAFYILLKRKR